MLGLPSPILPLNLNSNSRISSSHHSFSRSGIKFHKRTDLPPELYNLDILDGSPPCTPFSYCGNRHHDWGKNKKYQEGKTTQIIDTLFFDFIELANKLQPKIIIAENVEAILHGKAKKYVEKIISELQNAGYTATYYKLDAANMGIPQFRKRVFFTAIRNDVNIQLPQTMIFNEPNIPFKDFINNKQPKDFLNDGKLKQHIHLLQNNEQSLYNGTIRKYGKPSLYQARFIYDSTTPATLCAAKTHLYHPEMRYINIPELLCCHAFPQDYNFIKFNPYYITGMAVPPLMTAKFITKLTNQKNHHKTTLF